MINASDISNTNTKSGKWRLAVKGEFASGHALRHYQGKCESPHGHNFKVEAVVQGAHLHPDTGLLLDFGVLKAELKKILNTLDHRDLNQTKPFDLINPSSENLARHIYMALCAALTPYEQVRVISVTVAERDIQSATYFED